MQWNDGYVSDILYDSGVYREQMPSSLDAVCLVNGVAPPVAAGAPFTYCELGCGLGGTTTTIAAAYPQAKVWGFDFNPAHIAHARDRVTRGGIDNLVLAERSFEELAEDSADDLPRFDYVTLHGVWSWISASNRGHIVSFLRKHVAPGGLVSVSYNAMPGWGASIPMQHLLMDIGRAIGGSSEHRLRGALPLMRRIAGTKGSGLDAVLVSKLEKHLDDGRASYLSHEYLNEHWAPAFATDVAAALASAKLDFVGSGSMAGNFRQLCVGPEALAMLDALPAELQQPVQDFFCPDPFRRDVFIRGRRAMLPGEHRRRVGMQRLALVVPPDRTSCKINIPIGSATLNAAFYEPTLAALDRGVASVDELAAAGPPGAVPSHREILGMLIASHQVLPVCAVGNPPALARARRFNLCCIADALAEGAQSCWLASTVVGSSMYGKLMDMLIYEVLAAEPDGASLSLERIRAGVVALMAGRGMAFDRDATDATSDGRDRVEGEIEEFICKILPIWQRIGVI